jgi:hypothetical protein
MDSAAAAKANLFIDLLHIVDPFFSMNGPGSLLMRRL